MSSKKKKGKKICSDELIKETDTIAQILKNYPFVGKTLMSLGLECVPCGGKEHETLRQAAIIHGLDPSDVLQKLIEEIKKRTSMDDRGTQAP